MAANLRPQPVHAHAYAAAGSPWLPPGTPSTWVCRWGGINPRTSTTCQRCGK